MTLHFYVSSSARKIEAFRVLPDGSRFYIGGFDSWFAVAALPVAYLDAHAGGIRVHLGRAW